MGKWIENNINTISGICIGAGMAIAAKEGMLGIGLIITGTGIIIAKVIELKK